MNILSGDIGGTKTLLQLSAVDGKGNITELSRQRFNSSDYGNFERLAQEFIHSNHSPQIDSACFGVAGPVIHSNGRYSSSVTNLPWELDSHTLSKMLSISSVVLVNDFQSIGFGLSALKRDDFVTLQSGSALAGSPQLIVGAGTGLGVAQCFGFDDETRVFATEGGHGNFAPANNEQLQLAQYLLDTIGYSSIEFVLSGPGLVNVYKFVCNQNQETNSNSYHQHIQSSDPAASIFDAAASGGDQLAVKAMNLFVECYGSQAGNLALSTLARGGVYIAGGIAPKIIDWLTTGSFVSAFSSKSKMSSLLENIPIKVVMNPEVGLLGSQVVAARHATQ
ncbi:glucokinase [Pseudomonadota bacterium]